MKGYKLLTADGCSASDRYGRAQYDLAGGWTEVPGHGAYVALTISGLLRGAYAPLLVEVEVEDPTGVVDDGHVVTARRVRVVRSRLLDGWSWARSAMRSADRAVRLHALRCGVPEVEAWAARWLSGEDRSEEAALAAAAAKWTAAWAAWAAGEAVAAGAAGAAGAEWAAVRAAWAAGAAERAARAPDRFDVLAEILDDPEGGPTTSPPKAPASAA